MQQPVTYDILTFWHVLKLHVQRRLIMTKIWLKIIISDMNSLIFRLWNHQQRTNLLKISFKGWWFYEIGFDLFVQAGEVYLLLFFLTTKNFKNVPLKSTIQYHTMEISLLGCYARFSCSVIKWNSQRANITIPPNQPLYITPSPQPTGWTT